MPKSALLRAALAGLMLAVTAVACSSQNAGNGQSSGAAQSAHPSAASVTDVKIVAHGPKVTAGKPFNVQPNGESAMWLKLDKPVSGPASVVINGTRLSAVHRGIVVTVSVPKELYSKSGSYPLYVLYTAGGKQLQTAQSTFEVN